MTNLLYDVTQGIATVSVNRPEKMNALNIDTILQIGLAIDTALADESVCGIVLTGVGDKAFVAGADIAEFANYTSAQGKLLSASGHSVFNKIEQSKKPVIAAINGFALGGGCELAMACHFRIASNNAKLGQPEVNLGILPGYGGTQRLVQLIGKGKAMEMLMTGDMISADEALALGLVNYVTTLEELLPKAHSILNKIASKGPVAIGLVIECVNAVYDGTKDGFAMEIEAFGNCMESEDFKEGTSAFLEKRKANFVGR